jgi:hypothetical protein
VADLAADEAHRALGERCRELAGVGLRVKDIFVDRNIAVRADRHRCLVEEQDLHRARRRGLDVLPVGDRLTDEDGARCAADVARRRRRIDRRRRADLLPMRRAAEHRHNRRGEKQLLCRCMHHHGNLGSKSAPSARWPR